MCLGRSHQTDGCKNFTYPEAYSLSFEIVSVVAVSHRSAQYSGGYSAKARRCNDFREIFSAMSTSVSPELTAAAFLEDPAAALENAIGTEHISLAAEELSLDSEYVRSRQLQKKLVFNNRAHSVRTELALLDGGLLRMRECRRGQVGETQLINLRFLDATPLQSRFVATRLLCLTLGFVTLGALTGTLTYLSIRATYMLPATVLLATAATVTFGAFAYRTKRRTVFVTTNGRAAVFSLLATFGCFRACRKLVPQLVKAVEDAQRLNTPGGSLYLRDEMREHYRLRDTGTIAPEAFAASTKRILARFE